MECRIYNWIYKIDKKSFEIIEHVEPVTIL